VQLRFVVRLRGGATPPGGTCQGVVAWHIETGTVGSTTVSGRTVALVSRTDGAGERQGVVYIDDEATDSQRQALEKVWTGQLGGPVADLAHAAGEAGGQEQVSFDVHGQGGRFQIGAGPEGGLTTLRATAVGEPTRYENRVFSGNDGSPACMGETGSFQTNTDPELVVDIQDRTATRGRFDFVCELQN
jgi:hypothetical protein